MRRTPHSVTLLLRPLKDRLITSLLSDIRHRFSVDPYLFKPTDFGSDSTINLVRRIYESRFSSHVNFLFPFSISCITLTFPWTLTTFLLFVTVAMLSRDQSAVKCAAETYRTA